MSLRQKSSIVSDNVPQVYAAGQKSGREAERDEFWDAFQQGGERTTYTSAFANGWSDESLKPKYDITPSYCAQMFQRTGIVNLKQILEEQGVTLDTSRCTSLLQVFQESKCKYIPTIDARNATNISYAFSSRAAVVEIEKLMVSENTVFTNTFVSAYDLEKLIIEGTIATNGFNIQWSTLLSHESLMSIINALQDCSEDTSGTAHTITLGETNKAKLTEEELNIAINKGWGWSKWQ